MSPFNPSEKLRTYAENARGYLENARSLLQDDEIEKAGECLWGAMAAAAKAVAASKGERLRSHRQVIEYAKRLARDLQSRRIYDDFIKAQSLHANFYEAKLIRADVELVAGDIELTVAFLMEQIPPEARVAARLDEA